MKGYQASQADVSVFNMIGNQSQITGYPHVLRWYNHISSHKATFDSLPGVGVTMEELGLTVKGEKGASKENVKEEDSDDDFDLFGEDSDEDDEAKKQKEVRGKKSLCD